MAGQVTQRSTTASFTTKMSWRKGGNYNDVGFFNSEGVTVEFPETATEAEIELEMADRYQALKDLVENRALAWREEEEKDDG